MKGFVSSVVFVVVIAFLAAMFPQQALAAGAPADRVIVMYFHRTERCPTCLTIGGYCEEAVKRGFPQQLISGTLEFHYIDYQDKKNARLAKAYGVNAPALIVAKVANNKVLKVSQLNDMWTKAREKKAFLEYVRDAVAGYLKPARRPQPKTRRTR
ncbi:MAG: nitrophenyl compound nitroreductase subunit ArsF family protein [Planctomycetota bacterium]